MTDKIWDELWENINWDRVTTIPFITERIHKIKAEGDKLKEKADRLDELLVIYKRHYGNVIEYAIELQEKAEKWDKLDQPAKYNLTKYMECSDKIEAVRAWLTYAKAQGYLSISKGEQLDEILGAEG